MLHVPRAWRLGCKHGHVHVQSGQVRTADGTQPQQQACHSVACAAAPLGGLAPLAEPATAVVGSFCGAGADAGVPVLLLLPSRLLPPPRIAGFPGNGV